MLPKPERRGETRKYITITVTKTRVSKLNEHVRDVCVLRMYVYYTLLHKRNKILPAAL